MKEKALTHSKRISGLDLLRAVAILLVFVWHYKRQSYIGWLAGISPYGWTGVDLFFVLSGYLIASQLFQPLKSDRMPSFKAFYLKRSFRILPAYFAILAFYFLIPSWNDGNGLAPIWKFLTFTQNFGLNRSVASGFSPAWSLCVEEHFYLVLPLIVFLVCLSKSRVKSKAFAIGLPLVLLISGMALRLILWLNYIAPALEDPDYDGLGRLFDKIIYYPTYNRLDGLLMGVVIALIFTFNQDFKKRLDRFPNAPAVMGLLFLSLGCWITSDRTSLLAAVFGFPTFAIGFGGLVASAAIPHSALNRFKFPGAALMATLAYTFYLTHKEVVYIFHPLLNTFRFFQNDTAMILALFVICVAGAVFLHLLVEKPFLKLRDRLFDKSKLEV